MSLVTLLAASQGRKSCASWIRVDQPWIVCKVYKYWAQGSTFYIIFILSTTRSYFTLCLFKRSSFNFCWDFYRRIEKQKQMCFTLPILNKNGTARLLGNSLTGLYGFTYQILLHTRISWEVYKNTSIPRFHPQNIWFDWSWVHPGH